MRSTLRLILPGLAALSLALAGAQAESAAGIEVADAVAVAGRPVTLAVRTGGLFAAAGGMRVTLTIEGQAPREILTGGDGFGYLRFRPEAPGILGLAARAGSAEGSGRLLVLAPGEPVVVIEWESVLWSALRPGEDEACREALRRIGRGFGIVFVTRWAGRDIARRRIDGDGLSRAVALAWRGASTLRRLRELDIPIAAAIGSREVTAAARGLADRRVGFDRERGVTRVGSWSEIPPLLEAPAPGGEGLRGR